MKRIAITAAVLGLVGLSGTSQASVDWYQFSFTAADMMNYTLVNGADGSTAVDNSLFDGARLARLGNGDPVDYRRSYVGSENGAFNSWATTTSHRFSGFNLWGFDGLGAKWGDDFKHMDVVQTSGPSTWTSWTEPWPWGANPNPYTDKIFGWDANSWGEGYNFGDAGLGDDVFTFRLKLDSADAFFGGTSGTEPNTLGGDMTFWFGGWMGDSDANRWDYMYEGNMVLRGTVVPEPASLMLFGLGLLGLGYRRFRK